MASENISAEKIFYPDKTRKFATKYGGSVEHGKRRTKEGRKISQMACQKPVRMNLLVLRIPDRKGRQVRNSS